MTLEPLGNGLVGADLLKTLDITGTAARLRESQQPPGMLSFAERAMLYQILRTTWQGNGAVIDGGSFFGSSLAASAQGMLAGPALRTVTADQFPEGKPIHGYELGHLPAPANPSVDRRREFGGVEYFLGDSFVHLLEQAVAPYRELVSLHIGDLNDFTWDGSPIEVAFIDVCKTARLNAHVSRQFYPSLIPEGSILINQDFFFDRLPWIKVSMGHLKDYFRWEGQVFTSSVYSTLKAVPPDVAAYDPFLEASYEECLALHDACNFAHLEPRFEFFLALSRAYLAALKGRKDEALDMLQALRDQYSSLLGDTDHPRGNQFRWDRAQRQISNGNIFKVS